MTRGRWWAAAAAGLAACAVVGTAAPAPALTPPRPTAHVLVLSLPTTTWSDIERATVPNLRALFGESAVGALSTRGVKSEPKLGDQYVTISAGARAVAKPGTGDCVATAGAYSCPGQAAIAKHNDGLHFDADIGLLGATLRESGVARSVVAPAGSSAALALSDDSATVPGREAADARSVLAAFEQAWTYRAVVLVELDGTDLAATDLIVGEMLRRVDPARDAVVVLGTVQPSPKHLTVAAVRAPEVDLGLLRSGNTRRSGVVAIVDVGPTILDLMGVDRPEDMEGRAMSTGRAGGATLDERIDALVAIDRAALFRDRLIAPVSVAYAIVLMVLAVAVGLVLALSARRVYRVAELAALVVMSFPVSTYLSRLLPFYRWGPVVWWVCTTACAVAIAAIALAVGRRERTGAKTLVVALAVVVGVIAIDVMSGSRLQFNAVFGYSATVGGRFAGLGNLGYAQLAAAAVLGAALFTFLAGDRRGAVIATVFLGAVVVVDGAPFFGSDVGGVLSMVPAFGVTAVMLLGWKFRWRVLVAGAAAAVVVLALFGALDLAQSDDSRTHLGRLLGSDSGNMATVLRRKIDENLSVLRSIWVWATPIALAAVVYAVRLHRRTPGIRARIPQLDAAFVGLAIVAILGVALNDSGIAIAGVMMGIVMPAVFLLVLRDDRASVVASDEKAAVTV